MLARCYQLVELGGVTVAACRRVVALGFGTARNIVRIMACGAFQRAFALEKTCRFLEPIRGVGNLKLVVTALAWRMIEEQFEGTERVGWVVGERALVNPAKRVRTMMHRLCPMGWYAPKRRTCSMPKRSERKREHPNDSPKLRC